MTTHLATSIKNVIEKSTFGNTSSHLWFDVLKLPPEYINWSQTERLEMCSLMVSLAATFRTVSMAAAAKVKACHHPLQVSDVSIQVYSALQSMQAKVLPIKFRG